MAAKMLDLFKAAREDLYGQLRNARIAAATTDSLLHSRLILMEQMVERFFGYFDQLAQTGQFARLFLDQEEARKKGFADRLASYMSFGRAGI